MTEKSYGGNNGVREHTNKPVTKVKVNSNKNMKIKSAKKLSELESSENKFSDSTNSLKGFAYYKKQEKYPLK